MLLAFGPAVTLLAMAVLSGRGVIAMWGYPLWLFLGLWIVLAVPVAIDRARMTRIVTTWAAVFAVFAIVFVVSYGVMPRYDHRYRAVFYPGHTLGEELARRFRAATGRPLTYVISTMWDGGNVGHYAAEQPRTIAAQSPLLAAATTTSSAAGVPVRGVRLPPSRPFDLDTIANAGKPVPVLRPATVTAPMPVPRASFTSMKAHSQQSLARN